MNDDLMTLKILLPFGVFLVKEGVKRIVSETAQGSFGLLPHRLDCTASLAPGILCYETQTEGEAFVAIDSGILVKAGFEVLVSVRNAFAGDARGRLRDAVRKEFIAIDERERGLRESIAKLEMGMIRRFTEFYNE